MRQSFVFSPVTAAELRSLSPLEWSDALDEHLARCATPLTWRSGRTPSMKRWGLSTAGSDTSLAFAAGLEADGRMVPQLLASMHRRTLDLLSASPAGLIRAQEQTQRWLHEAEESLQKLELELTPSMRELERIQQRTGAARMAGQLPGDGADKTSGLGSILLRAGIAFLLVALFALSYVWIGGLGWNPRRDGLALAGLAVGLVAAGLITYRMHRTRMRNQRMARIELARAELTAELQAQTHDGLVRMHRRLIRILGNWDQMLREAMDELHDLSTPPEMPVVPPAASTRAISTCPISTSRCGIAVWPICAHVWTRMGSAARSGWTACGARPHGGRKWSASCALRPAADSRAKASQAHTIADFIRQTVRQSVAPVTIQEPNSVRARLDPGADGGVRHRASAVARAADERDIQRQLRAMGIVDEWEEDERRAVDRSALRGGGVEPGQAHGQL